MYNLCLTVDQNAKREQRDILADTAQFSPNSYFINTASDNKPYEAVENVKSFLEFISLFPGKYSDRRYIQFKR